MARILALTLMTLIMASAPAYAQDSAAQQSPAEFFAGKTITCYIGYDVGGSYDFFGRQVGRFIGRYIPGNPRVVVANKPGASSLVLGNFLAKVAPRDGTAFGVVNSALIFDPLFAGSESKAQFNGPEMTMIGNAVSAAAVLISSKASGVQTFADLKEKELLIGAMTRTGDTYILPSAVRKMLGLHNLKIVTGYPGSREAIIALERGEISGRVWDMEGIKIARPEWLSGNTINILAQLATQKMPEVPGDVPLVRDFVANEDDRRALDLIFTTTLLAKPFIAPPDIPADRVAALREAFMATMRDPEFLGEMQKAQASLHPMAGNEMERIVKEAYAAPDSVIRRVREALAD